MRLPARRVGIKGPLSCLTEARYRHRVGGDGCGARVLHRRSRTRPRAGQWGKPIGGFQLTQRKLADMAVKLDKGTLLALHLGRMKDEGRLAPQHVSMGKLNNVREALAREARGILGANGSRSSTP